MDTIKKRMGWEDAAVYALVLAGIYLLLLVPPYRGPNWISERRAER
jgi:hypothetical protein